jgi:hypothetical protein
VALVDDLAIPGESVGLKGLQNGSGCARLLARGIDVLNTNKPESILDPGLQIAGNSGYE